MQRLRILSIFSITQEKSFRAKAAAILHRVMGKNCVKASYNTTSGFHDVNERKRRNAYADDAIHPHRSDFPCTFSAEPTFLPFLRIPEKGLRSRVLTQWRKPDNICVPVLKTG